MAFWIYQLILVCLYLFWSSFYIDMGWISQIIFNFAIFYPLGFASIYIGKKFKQKQRWTVFFAALVFNALTYLLAYSEEIPLNLGWKTALDFGSMLLFVAAGQYFGKKIDET